MSNVDDEIVSMQFDNKQFESGVATSIGTLDKLKSSLSFQGAGQGLSDINRAVGSFNMNPMSASIQGVSKLWLGLTTVAVTAISNITNKAIDSGIRMAKALTLDPIAEGFQNYETKINAVQTILSNTQAQGTKLKDVTKALGELNKYANKTVYNFSEMARNIGTFTAAGVDLKTSTSSIKGIANLAALSGSTSTQASSAMYQLSQAIAAGQVHLQDWNSVVNAGIGGAVFQKALVNTGVAMGTISKSAVATSGPMKTLTVNGLAFRNSLTPPPGGKSWLTTDVLTKTLGQFTGDLSNAQLAAEGFSKAQIKAIQAQAKTANDAATKIKTFTQLQQALKEEVGTAWAGVWEAIFGNINQAKAFFSPLHTALENALTQPVYALAKILKGWRKLGGFDDLIQGFENIAKTVGNLVRPFVDAFHAIFPATGKAGAGLASFTHGFEEFTGVLEKASRGAESIEPVIEAIFKVFKEGLSVIGDVASAFGDLFDGLNSGPLDKVGDSFERVNKRLSPLQSLLKGFLHFVTTVGKAMQPFVSQIGDAFSQLGDAIAGSISSGNFSAVFDALNTVLIGGIGLMIHRFFKKGGKLGLDLDIGGGLFSSIKGTFGELTNTMKAMQTQIKAQALEKIAIAIGILTASVLVLSLIDSKKLTKALTAMAVGFGQLIGAMALLTKVDASGVKTAAMAASLTLLASAILVLSLAVAVMGNLDWTTIGKGLAGIGGALTIIAGAMKIMPKGMVFQAAALVLIGTALSAIGLAIAGLGQLSWEAIGKGLAAIAGALVIIAGAIELMPPTMLLQAAALGVVAKAIILIGLAVAGLGQLSWEQIAHGLVALGGALAVIAGGLYLMSGTLAGAAALVVASAAIALFTPALIALGHMSWGSILKGLAALAGVFVVLGAAGLLLTPLIPSILGLGAGLLLVGAGVALVGAGVLALATAFSILAAAGTAGVAVVGAMIALIPDFMAAIAEGIGRFVTTLIENQAAVTTAFVSLIGAVLDGLIKLLPKVGSVVQQLLNTVIDAIINILPKIGKLAQKIVNVILSTIANNYVNAAKVMFRFLGNMLDAFAEFIPKLAKKGVDAILAFLNAIADQSVRLANGAAKAILKFINGMTDAINKYAPQIRTAGARLGLALINGVTGGLLDHIKDVIAAAHSVADAAKNALGKVWKVLSPSKVTRELGGYFTQGAALGILDHKDKVEKASTDVAQRGLDAMQMTFRNSKNAAGNLIDLAPKVTPVLDLSQLQKDATQIGGMMGRHAIDAKVSRSKARDISANQASNHDGSDGHKVEETYNFNQTINSPKAVDHVAVYRGTRSQIALFKEVTNK